VNETTPPGVGTDGSKPPQGDTALRERLAQAAAEWAYAYPISANALGRTDDGAWKLARIWGEQIARIAVMPVVEAWAAEQTQRAEQAEEAAEQHARNTETVARERERYRQAWKDEQKKSVIWRRRAEQAEAAIARVRRLCEMTIASSCRAQAIDQAHDTLAALDRPEGT
jgi:hypothetical protein